MSQVITLRFPAEAVYLRYARVAAATLGDDAGLNTEGIEQLRVAVDELCAMAMSDAPAGASVDVSLSISDGSIRVAGSCPVVDPSEELDPIARQLLERSVDEYSFDVDGSSCRFSLTKRVAP